MDIGFTTMNTPDDVPIGDVAVALEDLGYDSLWIGEHSHIPATRRTPYPAGGEMPEAYKHMMDPFVSLTVAAQVTTRLLVATGVALPLERDVFSLAKTVSTLDHHSRGRLLFGVGVGWNREQLADHRPDIPWSARYRALDDGVAALRALWTDDETSHDGEFFRVDRAWSFPKPLQRPHPPVLVGGSGPLGTAQAARWGDGWAPMDVGLGDVEQRVTAFRHAVADGGRRLVPITLFIFGDPNRETLARYRDLGIERCVIGANRTGWDDPSTAPAFLERHAAWLDDLR